MSAKKTNKAVPRASKALPTPTFFATPALFRRWLHVNHATAAELHVGYYKKETGKASVTWPESVDEALCYGWIDGISRSLGAEAFMIRFTPRKAKSIWSNVNIKKVEALLAAGRMQPAGLAAWAKRTEERSGVYAFEGKAQALSDEEVAAFRKKGKAWAFWESQPPGYRRTAMHWVTSAKRTETRIKRLAQLIADSAAGLRIAQLRR